VDDRLALNPKDAHEGFAAGDLKLEVYVCGRVRLDKLTEPIAKGSVHLGRQVGEGANTKFVDEISQQHTTQYDLGISKINGGRAGKKV
jgi:hypothetical protein